MSDSIAIIGGGLDALTSSIGLTRHGIKHKIYESAAEFAEIGAGVAMGPNALTPLTLLDPRVRKATTNAPFTTSWRTCETRG
jgi:salicylate hydroxylase